MPKSWTYDSPYGSHPPSAPVADWSPCGRRSYGAPLLPVHCGDGQNDWRDRRKTEGKEGKEKKEAAYASSLLKTPASITPLPYPSGGGGRVGVGFAAQQVSDCLVAWHCSSVSKPFPSLPASSFCLCLPPSQYAPHPFPRPVDSPFRLLHSLKRYSRLCLPSSHHQH